MNARLIKQRSPQYIWLRSKGSTLTVSVRFFECDRKTAKDLEHVSFKHVSKHKAARMPSLEGVQEWEEYLARSLS